MFLSRRRLLIATAWACVLASPAQAQNVKFNVSGSVGVEASRNPLLDVVPVKTAASAVAEIGPQISYDTTFGQFEAQGFLQTREYSQTYGNETNFGIDAAVSRRASEQLRLRAGLSYQSTQSRRTSPFASSIAGMPVPPPIDDITVIGLRGRTAIFSINSGLDYRFNNRDRLSIDGSYHALAFTQAGAENYRLGKAEASFLHAVNEHMAIGLVTGFQQFDFANPAYGDARTISTLGTVTRSLGARWTLELSAGAAWTWKDAAGTTPRSTVTSLVTRGSLCYLGQHERACLDYHRNPQPTAQGGVRGSDRLGFSYRRDVSRRDRVTLGASYARSSSSVASSGSAFPEVEFGGGTARYERRLSPRTNAYVEVGYDRLYRSDLKVPARKSVAVGLSFTLGDRR